MVIIVILGDLKRSLSNGHYIYFYEKNKLTIIFISAQVNNLVKNVFLEVSQNSQGNTCVRVSFLIKKTPPVAASDITPRHLSSKHFRLLLLRGYEIFSLMDNNCDDKKALINICFLCLYIEYKALNLRLPLLIRSI